MKKWTRRRTWEKTSVEQVGESFQIYLDDRALLTPKKNRLFLPTWKLAVKVAEEWDQNVDFIDPSKMAITRLVNSALDKVKQNFDAVISDLLSYGDTDLLCYRTESPKELVSKQHKYWDPILILSLIHI